MLTNQKVKEIGILDLKEEYEKTLMQEVKNLINTQEGSPEIQRILGRFEVLSKIVEDLGHVIAT